MTYAKFIRTVLSVLLVLSMLALAACGDGGDTSSTASSSQETAPFDENNIVANMAVISDIHLSYANHTEETIAYNIERYARAVGNLYNMTDGKLDAVMMCGDYTSHGIPEQARTFASATKEIFGGIFGENCPKLCIGMGNHDTHWGRCMKPGEWYSLLGSYGLNTGLEADSLLDEGDLHLTLKAGDRTYHILYNEAFTYATNEFTQATMSWLNSTLKKLTADDPDQFIFIGTHGPIAESGIFGSDIELDAGADWATAKGNLDSVLKRYPQAVIFSGHTHYTERLETSIMQRNYTALNVAALFGECYCNSSYTTMLDGTSAYGMNGMGMGYLLELDINGSLRIRRIDFGQSGNAATVTGTVTKREKCDNVEDSDDVATAVCGKVTLTDDKTFAFYEEPWVIPAPDADKKFLKCYSDKRGKKGGPTFPKDVAPSINKLGREISVYFPAAVSGN